MDVLANDWGAGGAYGQLVDWSTINDFKVLQLSKEPISQSYSMA
jgi:hypothetical protein